MGDTLLRIYHKLPPPLRSVAASLRGFYLRHWRYGTETDQLVAEALERDYWSLEQWKKWQTERLHQLLHRAATQVPHYRQYWEERRRRGDRLSFECLENWPILSKEMLRRGPVSFLADDCDRRRMIHEHTSGTTGTPLDIWQSRKTSRQWYALYEARTRNWNGINRRDRWGIIGAQQVVPRNTKSPPFWVWNAGLNQLYLSAFHLAPWSCQYYLDAIKRYRVKYLLGYTNSLAYLAKVATESSEKLSLAVVITNGEPLSDLQRKIISEGFECPVRETYGMSEIVCGATECHAGNLHLWPEAGVIEILDEKYYTNLEGGILEALGRMFKGGLKLYVYPRIDEASGKIVTATQVKVAANLRSLFQYLIDNQYVQEITDYHPEYLRIQPPDVLAKLQSGDSRWEQMVPPEVAHVIKKREFFGYRRLIAA